MVADFFDFPPYFVNFSGISPPRPDPPTSLTWSSAWTQSWPGGRMERRRRRTRRWSWRAAAGRRKIMEEVQAPVWALNLRLTHRHHPLSVPLSHRCTNHNDPAKNKSKQHFAKMIFLTEKRDENNFFFSQGYFPGSLVHAPLPTKPLPRWSLHRALPSIVHNQLQNYFRAKRKTWTTEK